MATAWKRKDETSEVESARGSAEGSVFGVKRESAAGEGKQH